MEKSENQAAYETIGTQRDKVNKSVSYSKTLINKCSNLNRYQHYLYNVKAKTESSLSLVSHFNDGCILKNLFCADTQFVIYPKSINRRSLVYVNTFQEALLINQKKKELYPSNAEICDLKLRKVKLDDMIKKPKRNWFVKSNIKQNEEIILNMTLGVRY